MSRKNILHAGPDRREEVIVSFRKESDNTFTKITKTMSRDWKTGGIRTQKRKKPIEEGPYTLADSSDYEEKMRYQEIDGSDAAI